MNTDNKSEQEFESNPTEENDSSLEALVHQEQSDAHNRLREELGREPTQEEADRWLSEQTEGY
jgi:hypothetical protein